MTTPLTQIGDRGQRRERFSKPALTLLMGADGAGKTSWRRRRREQLPDWFLDPEWVADGVGDWNTDDARRRADELIADQIDKAIARRDDFGIETTYTDEPSRALVERAKTAGYRIRGYFIGTETPAINIERIHGRTEADKEALRRHRLGPRDGPWVDPQRVRERHRQALAALTETAASFDELVVFDNSARQPGSPSRRPR